MVVSYSTATQEDSMTSPDYDPTVSDWGSSYDVAEGPNHMIDETVTGGAFASVRDKAWHNLGTVWNPEDHDGQLPDSRELLKLAHCDFPIYSSPVVAQIERRDPAGHLIDVEIVEDSRKVNILRDHPETGRPQILGQASEGYRLWTPEEILCGFGDGILQYGEPTVSTCGALDEGRQVFMSFKLPKDILVGGLTDEAINLWLVVHTSFDGSSATTARITPIRAVCRNTINAGAKKAISEYKIRKTANATLDAKQAETALGLIVPFVEHVQQEADALLSVKLTNNAFRQIMRNEFGPGDEPSPKAEKIWEEKEAELIRLFAVADTQENVRGTAWAGLQAVTEYVDWSMGVKGSKGFSPDELGGAMFKRSVFGSATVDKPKAAALRVFRELAGLSA
jgi:phage/plasmid-like protein (TIGR03299 family)